MVVRFEKTIAKQYIVPTGAMVNAMMLIGQFVVNNVYTDVMSFVTRQN